MILNARKRFFVSLVYFLVLVFIRILHVFKGGALGHRQSTGFYQLQEHHCASVHFKMMATKTLSQTLPYFLKNKSERKSHQVLDQDPWTGDFFFPLNLTVRNPYKFFG